MSYILEKLYVSSCQYSYVVCSCQYLYVRVSIRMLYVRVNICMLMSVFMFVLYSIVYFVYVLHGIFHDKYNI